MLALDNIATTQQEILSKIAAIKDRVYHNSLLIDSLAKNNIEPSPAPKVQKAFCKPFPAKTNEEIGSIIGDDNIVGLY